MKNISIVPKEVGSWIILIYSVLMLEPYASNENYLHRTYVGAIERGDRNVSLKNIVIIAQALNVEPSELLLYKKELKE